MKNKLEVIRQDNIQKCWGCDGTSYIVPDTAIVKLPVKNPCKICEGTGLYNETSYIHIVNGIAFSGDSLK